MRLGLIARADASGLANQSHEVWRHLQPARTLVLDLGAKNRGPFRPHRFTDPDTETRVSTTIDGRPYDEEIRWLVEGTDVIYSAESPMHPGLNSYCAEHGVRLVIHANPELWDDRYGAHGAEVWVATDWRLDLLPERAEVVPFPVASDRFTPRIVEEVVRVLHVSAVAMCDRNGTELVETAARTFDGMRLHHPGYVEDYWDLYDADALLLPRRYAGLCLTMQEAAAAGLPLVMLESDPNARHTLPELRIPVTASTTTAMKGGAIEVYDADVRDVAATVRRLADPAFAKLASACSLAWADAISWERLAPEWRKRLC